MGQFLLSEEMFLRKETELKLSSSLTSALLCCQRAMRAEKGDTTLGGHQHYISSFVSLPIISSFVCICMIWSSGVGHPSHQSLLAIAQS